MKPLTIFQVEGQFDFVIILKHYLLSFWDPELYRIPFTSYRPTVANLFFCAATIPFGSQAKKFSRIILCIHRWPIAEVLARQYKNKVNEDKVAYYLFISPSTHALPFSSLKPDVINVMGNRLVNFQRYLCCHTLYGHQDHAPTQTAHRCVGYRVRTLCVWWSWIPGGFETNETRCLPLNHHISCEVVYHCISFP